MTRAVANQDRVQALRGYLMEHRDRIAHAIPATAVRYLTPERVCRVVLIAATKTPALLQCTPASIVNAAMQAASYGLEPGGALGEAALVPYGDQCSFQFQYRGLITLAMRHGAALQIDANVVREGDRFVWREGMDPRLDHEPQIEYDECKVIAAYAIATFAHGKKFQVVPKPDLDRAAALSKSPAWREWPDEMCKKVAIKRLLKTVALTPELADAIDHDHAIDTGDHLAAALPMDAPKQTRTDRAKMKLAGERRDANTLPERSLGATGPETEPLHQGSDPVFDRTAEGEVIP